MADVARQHPHLGDAVVAARRQLGEIAVRLDARRGGGDHEAFGEDLPVEPSASGAERRPHGHLLPSPEGAFGICSFWAVQQRVLSGEVEAAAAEFEHLASFANDLGLFAEEIDPGSGDLVGNFPQGYAHLALIGAATTLRHVACLRATHAGSRSASPLDHPAQRRARRAHRLVSRRGAT